jgi:predicted nuclease of predicted toxin-antitoxin system
MKFLVDHNVGRSVAQFLTKAGHDTIFVGDADPHMRDSDILRWAVRDQRILITQDHDFGMLVYHSDQPHAGVLLLRMGQARRKERLAAIEWILQHYAGELTGCFSVFENGKLRIRC